MGNSKSEDGIRVSRRDVLKLGAATAAAVGVSQLGLSGALAAPPEQVPGNDNRPTGPAGGNRPGSGAGNAASSFRMDIQGCPVASANVESFKMEPVTVTKVEHGTQGQFKAYGPGDAHYGSVSIRVVTSPGAHELSDWFHEAVSRGNAGRQITLTVQNDRGSAPRQFNLMDCFPTRWDPGEYSPSSNVACETVVCKVGRVEMA